jgi:DNA-binding transcriptional LysR family regulator
MTPKISLEQWRALVTVVEAGGYAQAAELLHKTQSSVSYLVAKLERSLDIKVFEIDGRRARLTDNGQVLYRRARTLVDEAGNIERAAGTLAAGWEPELSIAAEIIFPSWMLLRAVARFGEQRPQTRIQLHETVLTGTDEMLIDRRVQLAITNNIPRGFTGETLLPQMRFVAAAHPDHPLHQLGRELTHDDLRSHRHLMVRDTAAHGTRESRAWQGAEQRLTVSNMGTSIVAAVAGMGFAWYSEDQIRGELFRGELKALPLKQGAEIRVDLYLVIAEGDAAGPGTQLLAKILREEVKAQCVKAGQA